MSGYRFAVGWGELNREKPAGYTGNTVKIQGKEFTPFNRLPFTANAMQTPEDLFDKRDDSGKLKDLHGRFGAGVTISIDRNRNLNPMYDHGIRHFTAVSSGMYDVSFDIEGAFSPEMSQWLAYVYGTDEITLPYVDGSKNLSVVYDETLHSAIPEAIFNKLRPVIVPEATPPAVADPQKRVTMYAFKNWAIPRMFDLAYVQVNSMTPGGGANILGILVGCAIESITLTYESGNDATTKFKISGVALNDFAQMAEDPFDLNCYIADIPLNVLVAGCLKKGIEVGSDINYVPIAQTERAEITISNNLYKLPQCLDNVYSGYAYQNLDFAISTKTYSNDPGKYFQHLYGVDSYSAGDLFVAKKIPKPIKHLRITSDNSSVVDEATHALDIFLEGTYVGKLDIAPSESGPIMDEPELSPRKIFIAVTTTDGENQDEYSPDVGDITGDSALDEDYFYGSLD